LSVDVAKQSHTDPGDAPVSGQLFGDIGCTVPVVVLDTIRPGSSSG
jgi:hypothetical protein